MDTDGKMIKLNDKGIAAVYIALILVMVVALAGIVIDFSYMYITKGQLQNASDAAALAGITQLEPIAGNVVTSITDPRVSAAKALAVTYALNNTAAKSNVVILNDGTNTFSDSNDVTAGNWNGTTYTEGSTPVNALKIRARRTASTNPLIKPVDVFLGGVLRVLGANWTQMSAVATATAGLPPRAISFLAVCTDACATTTYPNGQAFVTGPGTPSATSFAWTTLLFGPPSSASGLSSMMCENLPNQDVCGKNIWSTMGQDTSVLRDFASLFYSTTFDSAHKEITTVTIPDKGKSGKTTTVPIVTGWTVQVPETQDCPPGAQGSSYDPKLVKGMATIHITAVCATGAAAGCAGGTDEPAACQAGASPILPAKNCCSNFANNVIVIDSLSCVDCVSPTPPVGLKPVLVQ